MPQASTRITYRMRQLLQSNLSPHAATDARVPPSEIVMDPLA